MAEQHVETRLGWFESGDRRKVAVVITSDGRRVHVPIEPTGLADVSLLDILLSHSGAWWPSWAYYRLPAGPRDTEGRAPLGSTTTDQPQDPCRDGKGLSVSSKDHTEDPFR